MAFRDVRLPVRAVVALTLAAGIAACAPMTRIHGFVPSQPDVARITPGIDDSFTVEEVLGRPSAGGLLSDSAWYYVQSTVQSFTYNPPRVVDRTVLAVTFDANGIVTGIDRFGIEDGRVINLTTRTTETGGRQMGVLEQLFGNILNIDASTLAEPQ
jgi:outer membrane protein assembly factor BamE (lipoprotein component of BamABCDE complex)